MNIDQTLIGASRIALLTCAVLLPGSARAAAPRRVETFPPGSAKKVIVQTDAGPIAVERANGGPVTIDVVPAAPGDDCVITHELRGGDLYLDAHAEVNVLGRRKSCSAGFALSIDAKDIQARSGSGDVTLDGLYKKADIRTGSGSIKIGGAGKNAKLTLRTGSGSVHGSSGAAIDAKTGSGDIRLSGLTGIVKASSGSGEISLEWESAPASGTIDVGTGSGGFTAILPASTRLRIDSKSGSGKLDSEFGSDARAPLHLTFRSGSGSAAIKKKL